VSSAGLTIQSVSPDTQPYDSDVLVWRYSISGEKPGKQAVVASIFIQWLPDSPSPTTTTLGAVDGSIKRQVWSDSFEVEVVEPVLRTGSYTYGEFWQLLVGAGGFGAVLATASLWIIRQLHKDEPNSKILTINK
jgi:hypothetical protein